MTASSLPPLPENNSNGHQIKYSELNPVSPFTERHMAARLVRLLLLLAGIETNPGPKTWRCSVCSQVLTKNTISVKCTGCGDWCHYKRCSTLVSHLDWTSTYKAPCCATASVPVPNSKPVPKNNENADFIFYEKEYNLKIAKVILFRVDSNPRSTGSISSNITCKEELIIKEDVSPDVSTYKTFSNESFVLDGTCLITTESLKKNDEGDFTIGFAKRKSLETDGENSRERSYMESKFNTSLLHTEGGVFMDRCSETPAYAKQNCWERGKIIKSDPSQDGSTVAYAHEQRLTENNESLIQPKKTEDSVEEKLHVCSVCENSYKHRSGLVRHLFIHTGERPYQCNICMKSYINQCELNSHKESHSNERRHVCINCGKRFQRKKGLTRHETNIHSIEHIRGPVGRIFACAHCDKSFKSRSRISDHMVSHYDNRLFECSLCRKRFKTEYSLKIHTLSHSEVRLHGCTQCRNRFKTASALTRHMAVHENERLFACGQCDKRFKSKLYARAHLKTHSIVKLFVCDHCGRRFKIKGSLREHIPRHFAVRLHTCTQCGKGFKTNSVLKRHMTVHENNRLFACGQCDKRFKSKRYVREHIKTHSVVKLIACCKCDSKFKTKKNLSQHMLVHSDVRLHTCTRCGKGFKTSSELMKHMTVHENKRLFACGQCDKRFKSKAYVRKHMKTHFAVK